jgi:uncharacterized protein YndB with AHSA1/START domain
MQVAGQGVKTPQLSPIVITRMLHAPITRVYRAWTDVAAFRRWWGPQTYTCPAAKLDVRVGGRYLACMRAADGSEVWSTGVYRVVEPNVRLEMSDSFADAEGHEVPPAVYGMPADFPAQLSIRVTFAEVGSGTTRMLLRHDGFMRGKLRDDCMLGWHSSLDKLAQSLRRD